MQLIIVIDSSKIDPQLFHFEFSVTNTTILAVIF